MAHANVIPIPPLSSLPDSSRDWPQYPYPNASPQQATYGTPLQPHHYGDDIVQVIDERDSGGNEKDTSKRQGSKKEGARDDSPKVDVDATKFKGYSLTRTPALDGGRESWARVHKSSLPVSDAYLAKTVQNRRKTSKSGIMEDFQRLDATKQDLINRLVAEHNLAEKIKDTEWVLKDLQRIVQERKGWGKTGEITALRVILKRQSIASAKPADKPLSSSGHLDGDVIDLSVPLKQKKEVKEKLKDTKGSGERLLNGSQQESNHQNQGHRDDHQQRIEQQEQQQHRYQQQVQQQQQQQQFAQQQKQHQPQPEPKQYQQLAQPPSPLFVDTTYPPQQHQQQQPLPVSQAGPIHPSYSPPGAHHYSAAQREPNPFDPAYPQQSHLDFHRPTEHLDPRSDVSPQQVQYNDVPFRPRQPALIRHNDAEDRIRRLEERMATVDRWNTTTATTGSSDGGDDSLDSYTPPSTPPPRHGHGKLPAAASAMHRPQPHPPQRRSSEAAVQQQQHARYQSRGRRYCDDRGLIVDLEPARHRRELPFGDNRDCDRDREMLMRQQRPQLHQRAATVDDYYHPAEQRRYLAVPIQVPVPVPVKMEYHHRAVEAEPRYVVGGGNSEREAAAREYVAASQERQRRVARREFDPVVVAEAFEAGRREQAQAAFGVGRERSFGELRGVYQ